MRSAQRHRFYKAYLIVVIGVVRATPKTFDYILQWNGVHSDTTVHAKPSKDVCRQYSLYRSYLKND